MTLGIIHYLLNLGFRSLSSCHFFHQLKCESKLPYYTIDNVIAVCYDLFTVRSSGFHAFKSFHTIFYVNTCVNCKYLIQLTYFTKEGVFQFNCIKKQDDCIKKPNNFRYFILRLILFTLINFVIFTSVCTVSVMFFRR